MRDDLLPLLREFTGAILNPFDLQELLQRLTEHSMRLLDGSGSGIMLEDHRGELMFAAASDSRIVEIELHQEQVREGVCFEAYVANRLLAVDDVRRLRQRWPDGYAQRVDEAGLRGVVGAPMHAFGRTIGVINTYRDDDTAWTPDDLEAAEIIAAIGAGYIVHANAMRAQLDLTEHLQAAIDSRDMIGQAKGIIMAQIGVNDESAFETLRTISQRQNRKLRDVARLVIDGAIDVPRHRT